ncbi:hypothetical protein ACSNN7_21280 [Micromonospora sp. URMC 105]|uniref:hypothetical protein n=1 Tax=Micromonospora sp. URMC 105 TaxID=3423413 RepID=UPI003F19A5F9
MIADDADALTVTFHRMMRAALRAEQPGADTLGRTVELARHWGADPDDDARLAAALRRLHGEEPDLDDAGQVAAEATAIGEVSGLVTPGSARGRAIGKFAANARRLRLGEITRAEFDQIMAEDDGPRSS